MGMLQTGACGGLASDDLGCSRSETRYEHIVYEPSYNYTHDISNANTMKTAK